MPSEVVQALLISTVSGLMLAVILRLSAKGLLSFRYTVGWSILLVFGVVSGLFISVLTPFARFAGVAPSTVALGIAGVTLLAICVQLSISISGNQQRIRTLSEALAIHTVIAPLIADSDSRNQADTLVVVPAFNEESSIGGVLSELHEAGFHTLVVDDGSSDLTREVALKMGATVARLPFNSGVGAAIRTGLKYAIESGYTVVVQCDADGQHPVRHITSLITALADSDADMVIGSRFALGRPEMMTVSPLRRFAMWTLAASSSRAVGSRLTDVTSGFRAWRGDLLHALADHLPAYYLGDTYEAVVAAGRAGYRVTEIPSPIGERLHGTSSASPSQAARFTARAFTTAVLHLHVRLPPPRR